MRGREIDFKGTTERWEVAESGMMTLLTVYL